MTTIVERIRAEYAKDQANARPAATADELPISFDSITPEWLTAVLCADVPGARVTGYRLGPVDNGSSNRRKLYPDYNAAGKQAGLPAGLFCKATHDLANRMVLGVSGGARGEVNFYTQIRPLLNIEAPICYFARMDDRSFNSIIMLGDLTPTRREFCDHHTVMTRERVESQLRLLATLHGNCYALPELKQRLANFVTFRSFFEKSLDFGFRDGTEAGFRDAEEVIPSSFFRHVDEIWDATMQALYLLDAMPHTLAHCDVHLKNWYVAGNGEMGLSDWQCCGRAGWARDLAYATGCGLTVENRRLWERDLVRYYIEHLAASGGPEVEFETAFTAYRQQYVQALAYWTVTLSPPPGIPDMQPRDITLEFIRRLATAADDLDTLAALGN